MEPARGRAPGRCWACSRSGSYRSTALHRGNVPSSYSHRQPQPGPACGPFARSQLNLGHRQSGQSSPCSRPGLSGGLLRSLSRPAVRCRHLQVCAATLLPDTSTTPWTDAAIGSACLPETQSHHTGTSSSGANFQPRTPGVRLRRANSQHSSPRLPEPGVSSPDPSYLASQAGSLGALARRLPPNGWRPASEPRLSACTQPQPLCCPSSARRFLALRIAQSLRLTFSADLVGSGSTPLVP